MCAPGQLQRVAEWLRVTWAKSGGNAGGLAGKFCRDGIYCREHCGLAGTKTPVLLAFRDGMEFADPSAWK
jgi:hypothetical protein